LRRREGHAGKNMRFLFTDAENKRWERRVKVEQLIEKGVNADASEYMQLLYASAASLLAFSGHTTRSIYEAIRGHKCRSLTDY